MSGKLWTTAELDTLRRMYPEHAAAEIAPSLPGRSVKSVHEQAKALGLRKSVEWITARSRAWSAADDRIRHTQFRPGNVPANKGKRHPVVGRMRETQFKPGQRSGLAAERWKPSGTLRITKDGLLERKVCDAGPTNKRWVPVHRLVWEAAHGAIPRGMVVAFRLGMATTNAESITLDRLELITRAELMERNTVHRYPRDVKAAMHALGKLRRTINQRTEKHEEPHAGPA